MAERWEYVPGWIGKDGRTFVQDGVIAPSYVRKFIAEGGKVLRRRVGDFEMVTTETTPSSGGRECD